MGWVFGGEVVSECCGADGQGGGEDEVEGGGGPGGGGGEEMGVFVGVGREGGVAAEEAGAEEGA
ncbi:hypothetical protein GZ176_01500 [Dermatophilus congolensis]|nr:hypothetical protein [Dermatophilus congolensis]MBO3141590.1 hypothetical protein [Dermatophilus congolensis]MBO3144368.1 hypothetical protein [Dermatophilus congolensis]MBO3150568.1 hypothetical protein [Dermatophilus congolensis]MBO3186640.1 hypothetical protein [Dermatophilus congolensis]MBO3212059.1 hypothetical protein [Dermatophilus congolensis]